jgi:hypothetical protein
MPSEIVAAVRVQVFGDLVALLIKEVFESTGAHLEIWNWVNGSYSVSFFPQKRFFVTYIELAVRYVSAYWD